MTNYSIPINIDDSKTIAIDSVGPSVIRFDMDDPALRTGETSAVTLIFSEKVKDFDPNVDINLEDANGTLTLSNLSGDQKTYVGTFTPPLAAVFVGRGTAKDAAPPYPNKEKARAYLGGQL